MLYMRYLLYIGLISIISLTIASCGSGSGQGSGVTNNTAVVINLGQRDISSAEVSAQAISYSYIVIRISAPDMETIEETVNVAGMNSVEVNIEVPNGSNRHFEVFAYNEFNTLLCYGDTYVNLDGTPVIVSIIMICGVDETPPIFGGLISATAISTTEIDLNWVLATDDVTPISAIMYLIYISTTSGGQNFASPSFTTAAGATTYTVAGLSPSTTFCFVVRAKDEAGNIDSNTEERCTTTFSSPPLPLQEYTLTVTLEGDGSGTVASNPIGINCGGNCWEVYDEGTVVTLTPTSDAGSYFAGWSGSADCTDGMVTMYADKTCTATFDLIPSSQYTLDVTKDGTGTGTVTSSPAGINCGRDCSEAYDEDTVVTLTATPDAGSVFSVWGGYADCLDGVVTMNADKTCTATFEQQLATGSISGTVKDATNQNGIPNATVKAFLEDTEVSSTMTDSSGNYTINELSPDLYDLVASATGYIDNSVQDVLVNPEQTTIVDIVLSPELQTGEWRIVLTWGETPYDLDSHLWLPSETPYHIYYVDKGNQNLTVFPYAFLDVDDTTSYGPETITIGSLLTDSYVYAVHNYSESPDLTLSSAVVKVYNESGLVKTYNIPTSGTGLWWHVFDIDGLTISITDVNIIGDSPAPY